MPNYYEDKEKFFSDIYDKHISEIYRFNFLKTSSQAVAQDITSETFTRFWREIYRNKKIKNPPAFLYRVSRNLLTDFYRKKSKEPIPLNDYPQVVDTENNIEQKMILGDEGKKVRAALSNLQDKYRIVVSLRYIEERPIAEIAKIVGRRQGTIRVMLHRGLKQLRKILTA